MRIEPLTDEDYERIFQYVKNRFIEEKMVRFHMDDLIHEQAMLAAYGDHGQG